MTCPYCGFAFKVLAANAADIPPLAPLVCEGCAQISLLVDGRPRTITPSELEAIKQSPAYYDVILSAQRIIRGQKRLTLADGSPVSDDHREINPATGQQKDYVVLSAEERAKGFVRPVRRTYTHRVCGTDTTMGLAIAETYARDPGFYTGGTFCIHCRIHRPLSEFVWKGTQEMVGS